jgi:hypothetical protein
MPAPVGTWRSLVAYLNGVQGVPGSNPGVPTKQNQAKTNPPKTNPRNFLAIRKVLATVVFRHVRKCEELLGATFGHIFGHVVWGPGCVCAERLGLGRTSEAARLAFDPDQQRAAER